jgi:hypothetical protein
VNWIRLAQDEGQWRVDSVYNYWLHKDEKRCKKRDNECDETFKGYVQRASPFLGRRHDLKDMWPTHTVHRIH